jgi:hypothetical protein
MSNVGDAARETARKKILEHCKKVKLTPPRILLRISEGLDAIDNKVFYDKDRGKCITGPDLVDHGRRLEAAALGIMIHDMKPCEKKKLTVEVEGIEDILKAIHAKRGG